MLHPDIELSSFPIFAASVLGMHVTITATVWPDIFCHEALLSSPELLTPEAILNVTTESRPRLPEDTL